MPLTAKSRLTSPKQPFCDLLLTATHPRFFGIGFFAWTLLRYPECTTRPQGWLLGLVSIGFLLVFSCCLEHAPETLRATAAGRC